MSSHKTILLFYIDVSTHGPLHVTFSQQKTELAQHRPPMNLEWQLCLGITS